MKHIRKAPWFGALLLASLLSLPGCGGGGDGGGGGAAANPAQTGVFIDAAVEGLEYTCGTLAGTTNAAGEFQFTAGDNCTFKVGGVTLGSAIGAKVLTPVSLVNGATDESNAKVQRITQFVLSIDQDNNASNGVQLTPAMRSALGSDTLNFDLAGSTFETAAVALVQKLSPGRAIVSAGQASTHLRQSLTGLIGGNWTCTAAGVSGPAATASISIVNGIITGFVQEVGTGAQASVNGTALSSGASTYTAQGSAGPSTFEGVFGLNGTANGTWKFAGNPPESGTWSCTKSGVTQPPVVPPSGAPVIGSTFTTDTTFDYNSLGQLIGATTDITITATDPDGDALSYSWTSTNGSITGTGPTGRWRRVILFGEPGDGSVTVTVRDGKGGLVSRTIIFN